MTIILIVYGAAISVLSLLLVGIVHRLMILEARSAGPIEPRQESPGWITAKLTRESPSHLVVVVDETCSICHRTVDTLKTRIAGHPQLPDNLTVLANSENFPADPFTVLIDEQAHRSLHPGWAPAGLLFGKAGLIEAMPIGSEGSIDHVLSRMEILASAGIDT
jgi:hypothetical protein